MPAVMDRTQKNVWNENSGLLRDAGTQRYTESNKDSSMVFGVQP